MIKNKLKFVRSLELPICPFCDGKNFYENWVTHKIFKIKCEKCGAFWRSGIRKDETREVYLELLSSNNPNISSEYIKKKLSIHYWNNLLNKKINNML
jgi:hypothetical protein